MAAIRLAQLGRQVALVERDQVGGVCLNRGCIPSKALLAAVKLLHRIRKAESIGIRVQGFQAEPSKLQWWKRGVVERVVSGLQRLLEGNGVKVIRGEARLRDPQTIEVYQDGLAQTLRADNIVLATGSVPAELPILPFDGERVISSDEALELSEPPRRLLVVGGGYIGVELATVYHRLGSRVTIVEALDRLLPDMDRDASILLAKSLRREGVEIYTQSQVLGVAETPRGLRAEMDTPKGRVERNYDRILVAVGRRPTLGGTGAEELGVKTDKEGFVVVDRQMRTNIPHIYAVGDVAGPPMLAHKAFQEGIVAAEAIAGMDSAMDYRVIPTVVFTDPEVASVGLTASEAEQQRIKVRVGRFPLQASPAAHLEGSQEGFVKLVASQSSGEVLGVVIVGPNASSLIGEAALAVAHRVKAEELASLIHAHPTLTEMLREAAEAVHERAIHLLKL